MIGIRTPKLKHEHPTFSKKKKCYSILCLQDTHFVKDNEPIVETQWGYTYIFNSYKSNARGVCILLSNNFEFKIHNIKKDDDGNFLTSEFESRQKNIYMEKKDTFEAESVGLHFDFRKFVKCS